MNRDEEGAVLLIFACRHFRAPQLLRLLLHFLFLSLLHFFFSSLPIAVYAIILFVVGILLSDTAVTHSKAIRLCHQGFLSRESHPPPDCTLVSRRQHAS